MIRVMVKYERALRTKGEREKKVGRRQETIRRSGVCACVCARAHVVGVASGTWKVPCVSAVSVMRCCEDTKITEGRRKSFSLHSCELLCISEKALGK